jgi:acyl dehydratase
VESCAVGLVDFDPKRVVALRRVGDAVFKLPVRVGDSVHVEGQVVGSRGLDDDTELVEHRWRVLNQDGRMVLRMNVEVVCRRTS